MRKEMSSLKKKKERQSTRGCLLQKSRFLFYKTLVRPFALEALSNDLLLDEHGNDRRRRKRRRRKRNRKRKIKKLALCFDEPYKTARMEDLSLFPHDDFSFSPLNESFVRLFSFRPRCSPSRGDSLKWLRLQSRAKVGVKEPDL